MPKRKRLQDIPAITSSMESGALLKGSLVSDKRCLLIVERSTIALDEGSMTGSRISVAITGSKQVVNDSSCQEETAYLGTHQGYLLSLHLPPSY
jgi:hypothetical protein